MHTLTGTLLDLTTPPTTAASSDALTLLLIFQQAPLTDDELTRSVGCCRCVRMALMSVLSWSGRWASPVADVIGCGSFAPRCEACSAKWKVLVASKRTCARCNMVLALNAEEELPHDANATLTSAAIASGAASRWISLICRQGVCPSRQVTCHIACPSRAVASAQS